MASPNISEIVTTTIEARSKKVADNVSKSNALYFRLSEKGNVKTVSGGTVILEEIEYAENGNFTWYSGYDQLPVNAQDVLTAASFPWKQAACAVLMSGLEKRINSGSEQQIDLIESRMGNAERTMVNQMSGGAYSDGTGFGGKQLTGLQAAIPYDPTTGVYAGIDRAQWPFWRSKVQAGAGFDKTTIQHYLNLLWVQLVRGKDAPDLWLADNNVYLAYVESLQANLRFTSTKLADAGFQAVKYMTSDFVLDGAIGGFCPTNTAYALNTDFIRLRPHKDMNMRSLDPDARSPLNQDAIAKLMGWMGNITVSNASLQGVFKGF